jgi:uncharacterized membrane protein YczE
MNRAPVASRPRPASPAPEPGPLDQLRAGRLARRLPQLYAGLVLYGFTSASLIRAGLGNAPWDVLHQGIASHLGISIGAVTIAVSALVLLLWIPLREVPGLGTLSNAAIIGLAQNQGLALVPAPHAMTGRIALMTAAIAANAVATAMYIGARLGPGPRDGLMTGLHRRTGRPIWQVRTLLEISVIALGFLLGGDLGIGTLLYAAAIGPLVQRLLPLFTVQAKIVRSDRAEPFRVSSGIGQVARRWWHESRRAHRRPGV